MALAKKPILHPTELLSGNEAIARGALEAGIGVATSYAGTPASEIIGTLAPVAKKMGIYVEWSVNERAAVEVAAGASFSGIRALTAMKYNGLNVACDTVALISPGDTGKGGLVLVVADDPGGISSDNEQDTRNIARMLEIPLLEPSSPQEAKDMVKYLFMLSEQQRSICMLRTVTRVCHTRANVVLDDFIKRKQRAYFDETYNPYNPTITKYNPNPATLRHIASLRKLNKAREKFESSPFNWYVGPSQKDLLIITCGTGWLYSKEAVKVLKLENKVGILKLGTVSPLPEKLVLKHLNTSGKVLVVEEMDSVLERSVMELSATLPNKSRSIFYGKRSEHINQFGELNSDIVIKGITRVLKLSYRVRDAKYDEKTKRLSKSYIPDRGMALCPGCPHRATYWVIKNALRLDGRGGFATGDIGCYQMGLLETGYYQLRTCQAMGSGIGVASGMGKLEQFGFNQPVVALCGDSTFFHSGITGLINGVYSQSNFTVVIVDNNATAMTGFQPHPGTGITAMGEKTTAIRIEDVCQAFGVRVEVCDPFDIKNTILKLLELMAISGGPKVAIMRRDCELVRAHREMKNPNKVQVDSAKCVGDLCGCDRLCTRVFKCPGMIWNRSSGKAQIDEAVCSGCGVCVEVCPEKAIVKEAYV